MTTASDTRSAFGSVARGTAVGLFAGMALTVLSPRSVPYVAAGLVLLAVTSAVVDRLRSETETTTE